MTVVQAANVVLHAAFSVIVGLGYYLTRQGVPGYGPGDARSAHDRGRPSITVSEDYESLPDLGLAVQNVGHGPAKRISFSFSAQVESSDGFVLSDLAIFQGELTDLAPGARILRYCGGYHSHEKAIAPWRYEGLRTTEYKGRTDPS